MPAALEPSALPDPDFIFSCLDYDHLTGHFTWKHRSDVPAKTNGRLAGKRAGHACTNGYRKIRINGQDFYEQRLAWLYISNAWQPANSEIDHRDGDRSNTAASNLRLANRQNNAWNSKLSARNRCGYKGVYAVTRSGGVTRYRAAINTDGRSINLGIHDTPEIAHAAYCQAAHAHRGRWARTA